jgi:sterol desaturase/sphingolipid hydroxylase (fatty acid hydroxylase superfamily)
MGIDREFVRRLGSSKFNYWFGYVANLSLVAWLLSHVVVGGQLVLSPGALVGYAIAGFVSWTFSEYVLHRYVYHVWPSFLSVGHDLHHQKPRELIGVPWWLTTIILVAIYEGLAYFFSPATTGVVMGLNWFGYILYCISHHGSHHWSFRNAWLRWAKKNHQLHHAYPDYNWGFTTPIWDVVFRTSLPADPEARRRIREQMAGHGHAEAEHEMALE